jgi:hypothetical protein
VGNYAASSTITHPFLYDGTKYTTFDYPGSIYTYATGISGSNIVGLYDDSAGGHSFLYDYNSAKWTTLDGPLGTGGNALGISGNNIVGYKPRLSSDCAGAVQRGAAPHRNPDVVRSPARDGVVNSVRRESRRSPMGANPTWPIGRSAGSNQSDEEPGSEYQNSLTRDIPQQPTDLEPRAVVSAINS